MSWNGRVFNKNWKRWNRYSLKWNTVLHSLWGAEENFDSYELGWLMTSWDLNWSHFELKSEVLCLEPTSLILSYSSLKGFHLVVICVLFQNLSTFWYFEVRWQSAKMERRKICIFCNLDEENELLYGKIYNLDNDIVTHYYCLVRLFLFCLQNNDFLMKWLTKNNPNKINMSSSSPILQALRWQFFPWKLWKSHLK